MRRWRAFRQPQSSSSRLAPHGLWAGARLAGLDGAAPGYGALLSRSP